jgi:hypothetical protein
VSVRCAAVSFSLGPLSESHSPPSEKGSAPEGYPFPPPNPQTSTNRSRWMTSSAACGSSSRTWALFMPFTRSSSREE